jgi:nucleoside-diphosphate-sugar epimerase
MRTIRDGNIGANVVERNDGDGYDVYFLYNMNNPTHHGSHGDVCDRKTYKTIKMAFRKVAAYIKKG